MNFALAWPTHERTRLKKNAYASIRNLLSEEQTKLPIVWEGNVTWSDLEILKWILSHAIWIAPQYLVEMTAGIERSRILVSRQRFLNLHNGTISA